MVEGWLGNIIHSIWTLQHLCNCQRQPSIRNYWTCTFRTCSGFMLQACYLGGPFVCRFHLGCHPLVKTFILAKFGCSFSVSKCSQMLIFPTFIQPLQLHLKAFLKGLCVPKLRISLINCLSSLPNFLSWTAASVVPIQMLYFFILFRRELSFLGYLIQQNSEEIYYFGTRILHWKCWHQLQMLVATQIHISHFLRLSTTLLIAQKFMKPSSSVMKCLHIIGFMLFGGSSNSPRLFCPSWMNLLSRKMNLKLIVSLSNQLRWSVANQLWSSYKSRIRGTWILIGCTQPWIILILPFLNVWMPSNPPWINKNNFSLMVK